MPVSAQEMCVAVWDILQKSPTKTGYFTPDKVLRAVNDCLEYVSVLLMDAPGGGWMDDIRYVNTVSGQAVVDLPEDIAIIREARYKIGDQYVPIFFDAAVESRQFAPGSSVTGYPSKFRLLGRQMYFNPALGEGGTGYLQLECAVYAEELRNQSDFLPANFDRAAKNYVKWRAAGQLAPIAGRDKQWAGYEVEWYNALLIASHRRISRSTPIREYSGD